LITFRSVTPAGPVNASETSITIARIVTSEASLQLILSMPLVLLDDGPEKTAVSAVVFVR